MHFKFKFNLYINRNQTKNVQNNNGEGYDGFGIYQRQYPFQNFCFSDNLSSLFEVRNCVYGVISKVTVKIVLIRIIVQISFVVVFKNYFCVKTRSCYSFILHEVKFHFVNNEKLFFKIIMACKNFFRFRIDHK